MARPPSPAPRTRRWPPGDGVTVGPLTGTVAPGDSLEAYGGSLKMVLSGITVTCTAEGAQSPGPFVYE